MSESWLKILGFDPSRIPEGARTEFIWTHVPTSWGVFVLLACVAGLLYLAYALYRRETAQCPRLVKVVLAVIRMTALVVLVLVFMGPALAVSITRTLEPYVLVLLDDSLSMSIEDHYEEETLAGIAKATGLGEEALRSQPPSRAELVNALLRKDQGKFLRRLQEHGRVRIVTFSDKLQVREALGLVQEAEEPESDESAVTRGEPVPPLVPAGTRTNLPKAIRESLKSLGGQPVAALVLITDGQNTSGGDPAKAAELAREQGAAILALGVGDPRDPQNLRVVEAWAPETVFRGDPFLVQGRIQAEGIEDRSVQVELVERSADDAAGNETVLETKTVPLRPGAATTDVSFTCEPKAKGEFIYTVRVAPQPRELLKSDNHKSVRVKVITEQARVLLVAGSPLWEFRMVRTLLIRDKTIDVSCWLQSLDGDMRQDGNTVIERFPQKQEDLFKYDVLILFDPDPMEFDQERIDAIEEFVGTHAGGLLWVAGAKYSPRFLSYYRTRGIRDLLPVRLGDVSASEVKLLVTAASRERPMRVTAEGLDHPLLQLDDSPRVNERLWRTLPGVYWSFPAMGAKPGALTLLEHVGSGLRTKGGYRPLLTAGRYGGGRTLYMGFNSTWRWRKLAEGHFDRFWVQAIRFLVEGRLVGGKRRGRIITDRDVYPVGSRVAVTARLYDAAFEPLEAPTVLAVVRTSAGAPPLETPLKMVSGRPGRYEGSIMATRLGVNDIAVTLPGDKGGKPVRVTKQITVQMPQGEFADPRLARPLLVDVAERSGGRYFEMSDADQIADAIPDRRETLTVREKPRNLWDTSHLLILLVALLTLEWALRKRHRLM